MDFSTIQTLNQLNRNFYQTTDIYFDQSRQYFWQGWYQLQPRLKKLAANHQPLTVLDLGCGNGRFAQFLKENVSSWLSYHGMDCNAHLLFSAQTTVSQLNIAAKLDHLDLIYNLLCGQLETILRPEYDLIAAFGLLHHVPGLRTRINLLRLLGERLSKSGLMIMTAWQFGAEKRFDDRQIDPQTIGIDPELLEQDDYILDWKRGEEAVRYCHWIKPAEMQEIAQQADLEIIDQFAADGKSKELNNYYLLQAKTNQTRTNQA
ncbi:MAG: methyltransferase domain-containing protein [Candidatus Pacebacteria bacterium]|nr:methyltransferase domain-containing protein [Candidatus Paceibacterota bacterium]